MVAGDGLPQTASFVERCLGVVRIVRRNFQAHVAVAAVGGVIDGAQRIGRVLNIADRQALIDGFRIELYVFAQFV